MSSQKGKYINALTIAGSDSGGGAGIQADLKTFSALGVYGASVITAITAQNTTGVKGFEVVSSEMIQLQAEAVLDDISIDSVKTGMLPTPESVEVVASLIDKYQFRLIVDPVLSATTGARLSGDNTMSAIKELLFERATLLTPNLEEATALSGISINSFGDYQRAADILMDQGCNAVLIKGGHFPGTDSVDILFRKNSLPIRFSSSKILTKNTHGTGCTLSAAITAYMAMGEDLENAVRMAKQYVRQALWAGSLVFSGHGFGPVNHFFNPQSLKII